MVERPGASFCRGYTLKRKRFVPANGEKRETFRGTKARTDAADRRERNGNLLKQQIFNVCVYSLCNIIIMRIAII